jgi:cation/acetate symporter
VVVGMVSSLGWLLLSGPAYTNIYKADPSHAMRHSSQPGLVTIPLGFIVLIVVSLMTKQKQVHERRDAEKGENKIVFSCSRRLGVH